MQPVSLGYFLAALLLCIGVACAQPPENPDPALHEWFESLKEPGTGIPCCSIADCRPVDYRLAADGYEAFLDSAWVPVPGRRVLHGQSNPTGHAILCRSPVSLAIMCFIPDSQT